MRGTYQFAAARTGSQQPCGAKMPEAGRGARRRRRLAAGWGAAPERQRDEMRADAAVSPQQGEARGEATAALAAGGEEGRC